MTDETNVQPALTPEQWALRSTGKPCYQSADGRMMFAMNGDGCGIFIADDAVATQVYEEDRHALAALALFGQPFGFTHEDVTWLRNTANAVHAQPILGAATPERLFRLADRIAALLPSAS